MSFNYTPDDNGLFPATTTSENPDMQHYWIRDNYWIWRSGYYTEEIAEAFRYIIGNHEHKIREAIKTPPKEEWEHIHPRYDQDLMEIDGEWGWIQHDSVGNLLEVMVVHDHAYEANLLINYIRSTTPLITPGYGPWEDEKKRHSYSLACIWRGLYKAGLFEEAKQYKKDAKLLAVQKKELEDLMAMVQLEAKGLAENAADIVETGEYGVTRYESDNWTGEDFSAETEPEWPLGLCFMYMATGDNKYLNRLRDVEALFGAMPESVINDKPNTNTPLIWTEAMYNGIERDQILCVE